MHEKEISFLISHFTIGHPGTLIRPNLNVLISSLDVCPWRAAWAVTRCSRSTTLSLVRGGDGAPKTSLSVTAKLRVCETRGPSSIKDDSNAVCVRAKSLQLCLTLATPWPVACQAPLSMGFSRQEYWSGWPPPPPGDLPDPGTGPESLMSPALVKDPLLPPGTPNGNVSQFLRAP